VTNPSLGHPGGSEAGGLIIHCDAQHPTIRGRAGYMSDATFEALVAQLRTLRVRNLRVIGGGEPTLHPRFADYIRRRMLGVSWNGDVPLCRGSAFQMQRPEGLLLGNIRSTQLAALWQSPFIRQYRDGHRRRLAHLMPICAHCPDAQRPAWRKQYDNNRHFAGLLPDFVPVAALGLRRPTGQPGRRQL
jgi:hypothetical protein